MSLYSELKENGSRNFKIRLEANIDPCATCIVKDEKALEHCKGCSENVKDEKDLEHGKGCSENKGIRSMVA